ncbi:MAG: hypothetical protein ACR2NB_13490 [Solirubrobacteraceae bacterium]
MALSSEPPRGTAFWAALEAVDRLAHAHTRDFLSQRAGSKAPAAWEQLGTCLALLDAAGCCRWGCAGGDHVVEYLIKRAANAVNGAARLMQGASYDEALSLLRTAGEVTNLLTLFAQDADALDRWRRAGEKDRYLTLRPGAVLKQLAASGASTVFDFDAYDQLSRIAHGNSTDAPQGHSGSSGSRPSRLLVQEAGVFLVLNEASAVVTYALLAAASLLELSSSKRLELLQEGRDLVGFIGGVRLGNRDAMWAAFEAGLNATGK